MPLLQSLSWTAQPVVIIMESCFHMWPPKSAPFSQCHMFLSPACCPIMVKGFPIITTCTQTCNKQDMHRSRASSVRIKWIILQWDIWFRDHLIQLNINIFDIISNLDTLLNISVLHFNELLKEARLKAISCEPNSSLLLRKINTFKNLIYSFNIVIYTADPGKTATQAH